MTSTESESVPAESTTTGSGDPALIQRSLFRGPQEWVNPDLYARILAGSCVRERSGVRLAAESIVSTNTYFGRFAASYWQRWTTVREVAVSCRVEVEGAPVQVFVRASDIGAHVRTVGAEVVAESGEISIAVPVRDFLDGGSMWIEVRTAEAGASVSDVRWTTAADRPERKLALSICTFNRPVDCAATVATIASDERVVSVIDRIHVTDQGDQPVAEQAPFREAQERLGETLNLIRQPNLGGAGGFTRGIVEATRGGCEGVDVLLMDDDVRAEPESVLRLAAMARFTTEPTILGAQMLYLFNPDYLLASAEAVELRRMARGLPTDQYTVHNYDVASEELPERRAESEYNGWWSCLIPGEVVERIGYPLPVFFQWDDVEYSLRGREHGIATVTVPGAAVWHADFYWKDVDGFGHYFSMRNGMVTAAVRNRFDAKGVAKEMARQVSQSIAGMQYGLAHTHLKAVRDFLRGPEFLADGGRAALAEVNAERRDFPETMPLPLEQVPAVLPVGRKGPDPDWRRGDLVLAKRLASQLRGRLRPGPVYVPFEDAPWWNVSLYDDAYVTDASQTAVRHRVRDAEKAKALLKELAGLTRQLVQEGPAVAAAYREAVPELTSRENWERLYGF
ncbi:glycosyltransferase [Corynebacterium sp. NPDC060344]|uniref:glycosyltransferase n=1 Tax=Corynebacterium sp. NPDC060344 TaxID=3347101 RepID=UPI00364F36ED